MVWTEVRVVPDGVWDRVGQAQRPWGAGLQLGLVNPPPSTPALNLVPVPSPGGQQAGVFAVLCALCCCVSGCFMSLLRVVVWTFH